MTASRAPAKTKTRRPLDGDRIERAALQLIEKDGLAELSMRRLGAALGVEAMSLYHHYPSKAHLLDSLVDRLLATIPAPDPSLPWREQVRHICLAYRQLGLRYPRFAHFFVVHRLNTRGGLAFLERIASIFADAGFGDELAARSFRVMGYYLMGAVLDETAGYAAGPTAADPVPPAEQAEIAPTAMRFGPYFGRDHWERTFLMGLDLVLDGLAAPRQAKRP